MCLQRAHADTASASPHSSAVQTHHAGCRCQASGTLQAANLMPAAVIASLDFFGGAAQTPQAREKPQRQGSAGSLLPAGVMLTP